MTLSPAEAAESSSIEGVWDGTIGNLAIRACFTQEEWGTSGGYYYLSRLQAITLDQEEGAPSAFSEGDGQPNAATPRWKIDALGASNLAGRWNQGGKALPIALKRLKLQEKEAPCASMLFQGPRLEGIRTLSKPAIKDGIHYTRLILDFRGHFGDDLSVETFALPESAPAVRAINTVLRKPLAGQPDGWLTCIQMASDWRPRGQSNEIMEPRMLSRRWLVVNHHWDGYCGGAHPDSSDNPMLFDLTTGAEVNLYSWFNDKGVKRERLDGEVEDVVTLRPTFRYLLMGPRVADDECDDAMRSEEFWNVELTRTGFVFTPELAHVVQACEDDYPLSFAKAGPFLNAEGQKQVAALQAESASKR